MRADIRTAIRRGNLPQGYELQTSDIGRGLSIGEGFGVVQRGDVGKRCWSRDYGLVMESNDQRDKRKASTPRSPSHPEGETMSTYDRAVEAVENCGESSPSQLVTAILAYFSRADLIDFVERYIDDTIDEEEETDDPDTDEDDDTTDEEE